MAMYRSRRVFNCLRFLREFPERIVVSKGCRAPPVPASGKSLISAFGQNSALGTTDAQGFVRTGVTWTLPTSKRQHNQTDTPGISSNDFVFKESFDEGPFLAYKEGRLRLLYRKDTRQEMVVLKLQELYDNLRKLFRRHQHRSGLTMVDTLDDKPSPPAWWNGLAKMMQGDPLSNPGHRRAMARSKTNCQDTLVQGLYMYGGVGVGKTMLMDLFVVSSAPEFRVHRTHFHTFMLDVHSRLREYAGKQDPLSEVADDISKGCRVLALDELFVTDVADAMVLHRLFGRLWDNGVVLICTSNRNPDSLYEGGLQRDLFIPFIQRIKETCDVHNMESATDYRKLAQYQSGLFFVEPKSAECLETVYENFAGGQESIQNRPVEVQLGRTLAVPRSTQNACYYTFQELCGKPVGSSDYIALVQTFHSVCLDGIPKITGATKSEAYRLVTLIDVLYDHRIRLACTAACPLNDIFQNVVTQADIPPEGITDKDSLIIVDDNLGFAKDRTISRLIEMQSMEYLVDHANRHAPELLLALAEAQAKRS